MSGGVITASLLPDRCWCMQHAVAAGFPWISSETAAQRRAWERVA